MAHASIVAYAPDTQAVHASAAAHHNQNRRTNMSWSFRVTGTNRTEVLDALRVEADRNQVNRCPAGVLVLSAEAFTDGMPEASVTWIDCYGHLNEDGSGNLKLSINC
jgi:hypothetical protein